MIPDIHIVLDCADPDRLARFWMVALPGYDFPRPTRRLYHLGGVGGRVSAYGLKCTGAYG
jgi:hypothetical protein